MFYSQAGRLKFRLDKRYYKCYNYLGLREAIKRGSKMIRVLIPREKTKKDKALIRGYWTNAKGKIFYDYLAIAKLNNKEKTNKKELFYRLDFYKKIYKQEALFYSQDRQGFIYYSQDKIEVLKHHSIIKIKRQGNNTKLLRQYIKSALKLYNGLTIYIKKHDYILEVYYNKEVIR